MQKTRIEWTDYTWNPVTGCENGCPYCYARKISMRFQGHFNPTFHPERLDEPKHLRKPSRIFVCSMGELFGKWVPQEWPERVLEVIKACPQHTFQILTKCPENIPWRGELPNNLWLGVSVARQADYERVVNLAGIRCGLAFVSVEPLLGRVEMNAWDYLPEWVIIGAETPRSKTPDLLPAWTDMILQHCRRWRVPVFVKDNLRCYIPEHMWRREFPAGQEG